MIVVGAFLATSGARFLPPVHKILLALPIALSACQDPDHSIQLVEVPVTDVRAAVAFYDGAFGWKASYQDSSYAVLDAGDVSVAVEKRERGVAGGGRLVVQARDLEATLATLKARGAEIRSGIASSWRGRSFRCADPFGNELVVWSDRES